MTVSFLVPVFDTEGALLRICINSILHVIHDRHELIVVDDNSQNPDTLSVLDICRNLSKPNVKVLRNDSNNGVCYSLNKGAKVSMGKLLAPVDHDDTVVPNGVFLALRYQRYYGTPWLYTDEAQTDKRGYLTNYVYKPAFSKQLLRSLMYINRLQIFSREFFDRAGGYRLGFEGSQDHDLALRMSEISTPLNVPTVAYLRRISPIDPSINENTIKNNVAEK